MMKLLQVSICLAFALVEGSHRYGNRFTDWGYREAVVPYFFAEGTQEADRNVVRTEMQRITHHVPCITFNETSRGRVNWHHLEIGVGNDLGCHVLPNGKLFTNFHGNVWAEGFSGGKVELIFKYRLTLPTWCDSGSKLIKGGVLHELMHVLGIQHTQKRSDRDNYLEVNNDCVKPDEYSQNQYKKAEIGHLDNYNVPYKCNSIMHYRDFELARNDCKTMVAKTASCNATGFGGDVAIEEDWQLLREAHCKR